MILLYLNSINISKKLFKKKKVLLLHQFQQLKNKIQLSLLEKLLVLNKIYKKLLNKKK